MYGSFYGGKQGRSIHLVAHYDSIYDMVTAFQRGNNNTDVAFDEYVIIDTIVNNNEKNNPENGIIYRRGYNFSEGLNNRANNSSHTVSRSDYNSDSAYETAWHDFIINPGGGAIYIGQIVGPQGNSPEVQVVSWETYLETAGSPKGDISVDATPGYDGTNFTDTVKYGYVTLKDTEGNVTGVYLAFDIPYTVFTFEAERGSAYATTGLIQEQSDSLSHPYYKHYKIQVPQGIHGQDVNELLINGSNNQQYLAYKTKNYDESTAVISNPINISPYKVINSLDTSARANSASSNTNYSHDLPKQLEFTYTYGNSTVVPYRVVERIWKQQGDEDSPVNGLPPTLSDSHVYVLFSDEDRPRDLGIIKDIDWIQTPEEDIPYSSQITLYKGHVYVKLRGAEPVEIGVIKSVEDIWTQTENDTHTGENLIVDHVYAQMTGELTPHDLGYIKKVTSVSKNNTDHKFYTNYNFGNPTEFPVTEVAEVQFRGDNLWIGYRNLSSANISGISPGLIDATQQATTGITYINFGGVISGSHVLTRFNTYADLVAAYPNGLGNTPETSGRAGWIVVVGHEDSIIIDTTTGETVSSDDAYIDNGSIVLPSGSSYSDTTNLEIEAASSGSSLYAYDYLSTPAGWMMIQDTSASSINPAYSVLVSNTNANNVLNPGGLWFVVTN